MIVLVLMLLLLLIVRLKPPSLPLTPPIPPLPPLLPLLGEPYLNRLLNVQQEVKKFMLDKRSWITLVSCFKSIDDEDDVKIAKKRLIDIIPTEKITYRSFGDR